MSSQAIAEPQITEGDKEYVGKTHEVLTAAFMGDPVFRWLLHDHPANRHEAKLSKLFSVLFTQAAANSAVFAEVAGFGCCSVLMPPSRTVNNPWTMLPSGLISATWTLGLGSMKRTLFEFSGGVEPCLEKALTKEEQKRHWYIFFMGTAADRRKQGLAGRLLEHVQDRARADGCPVWLEATTSYSRDLYLKHGFELVSDIVMGAGKVGPDGEPKKGGEGITIYAMVWRP
ncbi:hypothetical protein GGR52DRAFT_550813 [Hypoxylon sp. FL1284]|nr:hypothetical protein GGR52DRAFT_550813 [Hypoxylon sp. FL1284]